jgi:hypothetical protein
MELAGGLSQTQIPLRIPLWSVYVDVENIIYYYIVYNYTKRIRRQDAIAFWPYSYTEGERTNKLAFKEICC